MINKINEENFSEIYNKYATTVLRTCYFYLKDREKAEDVCHDTFLKLLTNAPELDESYQKAWLLRVAINKCKDIWKSSWFKKTQLGDDTLQFIPDENNKSDNLENEELMNAIQKLPHKFKEVLLLHYYNGYGIVEISNLLGVSQGTVSSRLSRSREKLAKLLGVDSDENGFR